MRNIYESINTNGTKLTEQELLASSTDRVRFSPSETLYYHELMKLLDEYYGEMNENEKLHMTEEKTSINLFELLIALQMKLNKDFPNFIPEPTNDKDGKLDIVLKMYQSLGNAFNKKPENINNFIEIIIVGCKIISEVYDRLYDKELGLKDITKFKKINKNTVALFLTQIATNFENKIDYKKICNDILIIAAYHDLIQDLPKEEKSKYTDDPIMYHDGGSIIPQKIKKIRETGTLNVPSLESLKALLINVYEKSIIPNINNKRKAVCRLKAIAFSAFYNQQIPSMTKSVKQNKDHIIPFSTKSTESNYDICRLGNLQLIPEPINKKRGKKAITDHWIESNNLRYQHYPSETEYDTICGSKTLNLEKYDEMCKKREDMYLRLIMNLFN